LKELANAKNGEFPMLKVLILLAPLIALSGCCRVFGICTDVSVQSSLEHPENLAANENYRPFGTAPLATTQSSNAGSCSIAMR
jgi:hypothetical protein